MTMEESLKLHRFFPTHHHQKHHKLRNNCRNIIHFDVCNANQDIFVELYTMHQQQIDVIAFDHND